MDKKRVKIEKIAKILGLIHETHKSKEWLIQQIKRNKIKLPVKPTMNSFEILNLCPDGFLSHLLRVLNDPFDPSVEIPILTRSYNWFFTDIVGAANPAILAKDQARKVWVLNELVGRTETFKQRNPKLDVMTITGDGMVIGFYDTPEKPLRLAIELQKLLSRYNQSTKGKDKLTIRIGIESGPVYFVKDLTGKDNFWGPGIIKARRIMDLARPMQILTSAKIYEDVGKLAPENKGLMHNIGKYKIKHNEEILIYNVYKDGIGNKLPPPHSSSKLLPPDVTAQFLFPRIEIKLDVTDPKTMLTHHTWLWKLINNTEVPKDLVSYMLDGDQPREFSDLNIRVKDGKNKKLGITLNENKPQHKAFVVKLNKPIKPNKLGILKLEYDWEETERKYFYRVASYCKKFSYSMTIPKDIEVKPRILKVDPATGFKDFASLPANIKYFRNRTEISWQTSNLEAHDSYQFEW